MRLYVLPISSTTSPMPNPFDLLQNASSSNGVGVAVLDESGHHDGDDELHNWSSLIGITTAIVGNVLIALALNVQRYAHIRLHRQRRYYRARAKAALKRAQNGGITPPGYGTIGTHAEDADDDIRENGGNGYESLEHDPLTRSFQSAESQDSDCSVEDVKASLTYLKSPYWWLGQVLITLGEVGNFLAYGFAPASIVSPLGVVALIANCVFAPMLFKEKFRPRDFWGVIIAVAGVVTVVLSAKQQETKLEPHDVWDAITTIEFEVYLAVTISLIILLMLASKKYGHRTILIDLGLVGLFGMCCFPLHLAVLSDIDAVRRWIHSSCDQRSIVHALVDVARRIHHASYVCARLGSLGDGGHASPLRE
jgi:magnesium transporter